jgi:hypothetical protein
MGVPPNFLAFAGKENLIASFNHWLMDSIQGGYLGLPPLPNNKEFFWAFDYPIAPQDMPAITTMEIGLFNRGEIAMGRLLGYTEGGVPMYGTRNQTLMEVTCIAQDSESFTGAARKVRNLRDRVMQALFTDTIPLRDYSKVIAPQIGTIDLDLGGNAINEKFLVDPTNQQIKRYVLLVRIFWSECTNNSFEQTITANAKIV